VLQKTSPYGSPGIQTSVVGTKSSGADLAAFFGASRLGHISVARVEEFKQVRRADDVKTATLNRDLRFLAHILKQAERERFIGRSPFDLAKFFGNEDRDRRKPHILSYEEQEKLLAVAPPRIRVLTVLGVETGMRTGEMTNLRWEDVDFLHDSLRVVKSKSIAGIRAVPLSPLAKAELLQWRSLVGPEFSDLGVSCVFKPAPQVARRSKGLDQRTKESRNSVLPNLLPEACVRFACDGSERLSNYDRSAARACFDAGGTALFGDSG
jgi:integrase